MPIEKIIYRFYEKYPQRDNDKMVEVTSKYLDETFYATFEQMMKDFFWEGFEGESEGEIAEIESEDEMYTYGDYEYYTYTAHEGEEHQEQVRVHSDVVKDIANDCRYLFKQFYMWVCKQVKFEVIL